MNFQHIHPLISTNGRAFVWRKLNAHPFVDMQSTFTKTKQPIVYSQSTIIGTIDDTTSKCIKSIIAKILEEFSAYLKSTGAVGANCWEYLIDCDYAYMPALNIEIQKHFDSSVFVRIYGGGVGITSNKLICRVNWGAD